ncbi:MAG: alpha/beta hydrolase [Gammaproteobacteria bacterium]
MTGWRFIIFLVALVTLAACSSPVRDEIDLMPAPDVYGGGMLDPLPEKDPEIELPYKTLLYATDREPGSPSDSQEYYLNERGQILRLGVARISLHQPDLPWSDMREISLVKNRSEDLPLRVTGVEEHGILETTIPAFAKREDYGEDLLDGDEEFAAAVNQQLARSGRKDIVIYVHGYKVVFENPLLVATELWHFLGYDGVMIGYAWPSTPSVWAYIRDSDTSHGYARHFRKFLEYLAENTNAEAIHVIAYSNGTRMVAGAFEQLALMYHDETREQMQRKLRLGQLILIGSDLDREVFATYVADGALAVPRHVSVYVSDKDKALGFARWLTRRPRLGQMLDDESMAPKIRRLFTDQNDYLSLIDVSDAEGSDTGNGHAYFRDSPWASSDILVSLMFGLSPQQRGLVRSPDMPVWQFPPDYIDRLWAELARVDPDFARAYEARQAAGTEP